MTLNSLLPVTCYFIDCYTRANIYLVYGILYSIDTDKSTYSRTNSKKVSVDSNQAIMIYHTLVLRSQDMFEHWSPHTGTQLTRNNQSPVTSHLRIEFDRCNWCFFILIPLSIQDIKPYWINELLLLVPLVICIKRLIADKKTLLKPENLKWKHLTMLQAALHCRMKRLIWYDEFELVVCQTYFRSFYNLLYNFIFLFSNFLELTWEIFHHTIIMIIIPQKKFQREFRLAEIIRAKNDSLIPTNEVEPTL